MSAVNDVITNRRRRNERSALGLCIDCGRNPRTETAKRCVGCCKKATARQKRYLKSIKPGISGHADEGEMTFEEIAAELGISRERARHIYLRALMKLQRQCDKMGMDASMIIGRGFSMLATAERWA